MTINVGIVAAEDEGAGARVLAGMLAAVHPDWPVTVLAVPGVYPDLGRHDERFRVLRYGDLPLHGLESLVAGASPHALESLMRPMLAEQMLAEGAESVLVLAADAEIYGPLAELATLIEDHEVVLAPRLLGRLPDDGERPDGSDLLDAGEIDEGLVAVRGGDGGHEFVAWWRERAAEAAVAVSEAGEGSRAAARAAASPLAAASRVFARVAHLEDPGYDLSYWNLHERPLAREGDGLTAGGRPLRLARFPGFRPDRPWWLSEHATRVLVLDDPVLTDLCGSRAAALRAAGWMSSAELDMRREVLANGVRYDRRLRLLHDLARSEGENFGDVLTPAGAEAFALWLHGPAPRGGAAGVNRYVFELWRERDDVQRAYPDLDDEQDAEGLIGWAWAHGRVELGADERLLPPPPDWLDDGEKVPVTLVTGYLRGNLGLGEAARGYTSALQAAEVPVGTQTVRTDPPADRASRGAQARRDERAYDDIALPEGVDPEVNIVCVNADQLPGFVEDLGPRFLGDRYTIGCWAWETDFIPERWEPSFALVDEIWVYSNYVAEHIARAGDVPVVVMPLPVEPPDRGVATPPFGGDEYLFLFVFDFLSTLERKNPSGLVEAFKRAFDPGEGPVLLLKTINADLRPEAREQLRYAIGDRDDIRLMDQTLPPDQLAALFGRADCYVSLHRSEGYGLTLAESMALAKPVIATGFSGNLDFMTPANSYLVDWRPTPVGPDAEHYPPEGTWAEPSVEHAAALMREVWTDRDEARRRGARAAEDVKAALSTEAVGRVARERLVRIGSRRRVDATPEQQRPDDDLPARLAFDLEGRREDVGRARRAVRRALFRLLRPYTASQRRLDEEIVASLRGLSADQDAERARIARQDRRIVETGQHFAALRVRHDSLASQLEKLDPLAVRAQLDELIGAARALPPTAGDPFELFSHPVAGRVIGVRRDAGGAVDAQEGYRSFEDLFRGSREGVRKQLAPYVRLLRGHEPVLDVGCGRGELMELLREAGVAARGVDIDAGMLAQARDRGLEVVEGDAFAHIASLEDDSLGAVFSAQVIEHLPRRSLPELFRVARAKIRPGGIFVAETINPHVGHALKTFWVDVTHEHPIFPEVALFLAADAGFREAFIWHPLGVGDVERDRYVQPSYAVVATV